MREKIKELRLQNKGYKTIANELGVTRATARYHCKKMGLAGIIGGVDNIEREKRFKKDFEDKYTGFIYHSGFKDVDGKFKMQCKTCGHVQERNAQLARPSRDKVLSCDYCSELARNRMALIEVINKEIRQINKQKKKEIQLEIDMLHKISNNHKHYLTCEECGKQYFSSRNRITCSIECGKKRQNRMKEINRRYKLKENGKIHWDIALDKLIDRDNNTCYICGKKCDKNDYITREDGVHISGENYPSIDHVKPVAKGGTHTWDNVKLAHRGCNCKKRDKRVYIKQSGQLTFAL